MGGSGSGRRWHIGAKSTTVSLLSLDVRQLHRRGLLAPFQSYGWEWTRDGERVGWIQIETQPDQLILTYRHRRLGEAWHDESCPVVLDWTRCHFGNTRPWFLCPRDGCARRVAILYGSRWFFCRGCHQLAYPSQRENVEYRTLRRAEKIRDRLGWFPGILNGHGDKPKGMHWKTFMRLSEEHDIFVGRSLIESSKWLRNEGVFLPSDGGVESAEKE